MRAEKKNIKLKIIRRMKGVYNHFIIWVCAVLICVVPAGNRPARCGEASPLALETITVTASKRESLANEFPGSISITDAEFIDDHQIRTTQDLAGFIPNLYYKHATSGDAFVCRGISTIDTSLFSPMGLYVNDTAFPLSYMQMQPLMDVARVEVLRGPQSTLYGKNSSSGVINVVLAEPDSKVRARVLAEAGSYNTRHAQASLSGPLTEDTLFYRMAVSRFSSDGFAENMLSRDDEAAGDETLSARGTLKWTPAGNLSLSLSLDGTDRDLGLGALRYESGPYATDRFKVSSNGPDRAEQDALGQSFKVEYGFGDLDFMSISSHRQFDRVALMDFDRSPVALGYSHIDLDQESWTQEFRLSSSTATPLSWLLGLYASRHDLDNAWQLNHVNPAIANRRFSQTDTEGIALFGQSTLAATPRLDLTLGLRLDHSSASGTQTYTRNIGTTSYSEDISDTQLLPMASLSWAFTERIRGYATFSTGWLAGGYDFYSATSKDAFAYDPEYTRNYEAGVKSTLFNNRLRMNLSAFYTDIDDKQIREELPGGGIGAWQITNAAQAHTAGVELEITAMPFNRLELFGGLGYARIRIDTWTSSNEDYSGNSLPWAPDLTGNVGIGYYSNNGWYGVADLLLAGRQYFDAANTLSDSGYTLANLRAGYRFKNMDLSLWCKNLFDENYARKKVTAAGGSVLVEDGAPLTLGLTFKWRL